MVLGAPGINRCKIPPTVASVVFLEQLIALMQGKVYYPSNTELEEDGETGHGRSMVF